MSVDDLLARARSRLGHRPGPAEVEAALAAGALVVDIRPRGLRERDGTIPGAVCVERNVLEWRLDPASPDRLPGVRAGQAVIVVCDEGYASSLAAVSLRDAGVPGATDLDGGIQAWIASGRGVAEGV